MTIGEGIYESLINQALRAKLAKLPSDQFYFAKQPIDKAEACDILAEYLKTILLFALRQIQEQYRDDSVGYQIAFCNRFIRLIDEELSLSIDDDLLYEKGEFLTAVLSKIGRTDQQLQSFIEKAIPKSGLSVSSLFTGSNAELSIDTEIERDILSSDRIYWIVSFIRWSGLRIFENSLREFTKRSGTSFHVITTTYMGASEVRALEFLSSLPNTTIKISYQTSIERLHAKAYIFERNSGFDSAYIGSSNLSRSALTKGLEWNIRVTSRENHHIIEKAKATFQHYSNSTDFEDFREGGIERFREAIRIERLPKNASDLHEYLRLHPLPFQKEILDRLRTERELHQRYRNLIVAATGTGKTVISAFDYKRYYQQTADKYNLLFVAHRQEILEQARAIFRSVLDDRKFGDLWVGVHEPQSGDLSHLFISVQTFNNQKELFHDRCRNDFYDFIIIDEAHHSQADSYRVLFSLFKPKILLGLTATPERMDGRSLLPDFCDRIASDIRLPDALSLKLLTPFQYFCVDDETVDLSAVKWRSGVYDTAELSQVLDNKNRVRLIIDAIKHYLSDPHSCKALCFCASKEHAEFMSSALQNAGLRAQTLVSGSRESSKLRENVKQKLRQGEVNFICVVDMFNEGVDIPEIDTVLFLRPTESLTVFLQQLGRGLRISENKECLTVLDFVSQAHQNFNFAERFRALVGRTRHHIDTEIEQGFPNLPVGCTINLEPLAKQYILCNIRNAIFSSSKIRREMTTFTQNSYKPLTLMNFLEHHHLDIRTVYNNGLCWTSRKKDAGLINIEERDLSQQLIKGVRRLIQIDSPVYLKFIQQLIKDGFRFDESNIEKQRFALMFYYDIWQKELKIYGFSSIVEALQKINTYEEYVQEIREIVDYLWEHLEHITTPLSLGFPNVLELHAQYSRDQILAAFEKSTPDKKFPSQEGLIALPKYNAEVMLVTLNKSDKDFSQSTLYDDYAISEDLFHWQTQNRVSPETPTGQAYIHHMDNKKTLLLFVRESKKDAFGFTMPYHFLGPVNYQSHSGEKPMSIIWVMENPIPAYLWNDAAKMAVG
jgi:superfamily II DNA or RNA helicase/HKD family nuclease